MSEAKHRPTLVFIVGPPAVGKMAVGHELAQRTGFKLFHNHHTIDLALRFFPYGTPPFQRLVSEFRRRIFEEVAASQLPGLIFTYVWAFDHPSDDDAVANYATIFSARGGRVVYVELECALAERLRRNETDFRLAEKPFKRDVEQSRRQLLELEDKYQLNCHAPISPASLERWLPYCRIKTGRFDPTPVAIDLTGPFASPPRSNVHSPPPSSPMNRSRPTGTSGIARRVDAL